MNIEELKTFASLYEKIDEKAYRIYDAAEELWIQYAKESRSYRPFHDFDTFHIECDHITLTGSYSRQGDWGSNEYTFTLEDFLHEEKAIEVERIKIQILRKSNQERKEEQEKRQLEKEHQDYLRLKEKFEKESP